MKKQTGFALVELLVVVVLIGAIAGVGYFVWHEHNRKSPVATTSTSSNTAATYQSPSTSVPTAPQINNASDLNSAMQALNQTDITAGNTDSSQLGTEAAAF